MQDQLLVQVWLTIDICWARTTSKWQIGCADKAVHVTSAQCNVQPNVSLMRTTVKTRPIGAPAETPSSGYSMHYRRNCISIKFLKSHYVG